MAGDTYEEKLSARVRSLLLSRPRRLFEVVRGAEGAYPTLVAHCLDREGASFQETVFHERTDPKRLDASKTSSRLATLDGNPALYSWYFTTDTCERLLSLRDWSGAELGFLATPRLYEAFVEHGIVRQSTLLDLDEAVLVRLRSALPAEVASRILSYDAGTDPPKALRHRFDHVFFDPPWYPEAYSLWLYRALQFARHGTIAFALLPRLTRPSAEDEREAILRLCRTFARTVTVLSSFLEYDVPSFERAELERQGFAQIEPWKRADLVLLDVEDASRVRMPPPSAATSLWHEVEILGVRIFIDHTPSRAIGSGQQLLRPLSGGSIELRSPSRRDPARVEANVLTSRGHGAVTSQPALLAQLLGDLRDELERGLAIGSALARVEDPVARSVLTSVFSSLRGSHA